MKVKKKSPRRSPPARRSQSSRKQAIRELNDSLARQRGEWRQRNSYFHAEDARFMRFLLPPGLKIIELGCGTGDLLAALAPKRAVGIDLSPAMVEVAKKTHKSMRFIAGDVEDKTVLAKAGGPFDAIVLSDTIGDLEDVEATLANLHPLCHADTRVVVSYYSRLWRPFLKFAEATGLKMKAQPDNWLTIADIENLLALADFEIIKHDRRQLVPKRWLGIGALINRYLGTMPFLNRVCLRNYIVARPVRDFKREKLSVSVIIPARNERGNIAPAVERMPRFAPDIEIIFVEGGSADGTFEEMERVRDAFAKWDIKVAHQEGTGKGAAVRTGFEMARGDVLMILDADLTVPPEQLGKFYQALVSGKGEFINGTRLVYPMERKAMRFLNLFANRTFSKIFTWLLSQRFTDTLCGTKVLRKRHYQQIAANRAYFGNFDPFGDYDLIFGAAKANLKMIEVPIRYASRSYGETQISRFRHGMLLLRMVVFAYRKLKAV
ncbi:MAG: glycosyltransferase [Alphaproteobacteria bacterium]